MIDPHIFRAYDIRGKAYEQLDAEACRLIAQAFGSTLREKYDLEHPKVLVGRDARTSGPELEAAVIGGFMASGCHVFSIGETPSPVNYFTLASQGFDGSIQVTASHNPAPDNGLKLQVRGAEAHAGEDLQILRQRIEAGDLLEGDGTQEELDAITPYLDHLTGMFSDIGTGLKIATDNGNGVGGPTYTEALRRIGCELVELYTEPDGTFPNHPADPSKWETLKELQATVVKEGCALGFAYDGDGDRMGLVDEKGAIRSADDIILLLAKDHLSRHPGKPVVFTVSNSGALKTEIEAWGGKPVMCPVGHSFVEHKMHDVGALLGGEQSGHFFCAEDYFGFDDALMASLRVLQIVKESGKPLSELCAEFPAVFQAPERRPHCPDEKKGAVIAAVSNYFIAGGYDVETMDGVRIEFGNGAWAGIRQSNTSPCLSICMEARSQEKLQEIEKVVLEYLKTFEEVDL